MPILNSISFTKTGQPSSLGLRLGGPRLDVEVSVHPQLAAYLRQQGMAVPSPVVGQGLIDTGAGISAVHLPVLQGLGIPQVGAANVGTAGGQQSQSLYPAAFAFPGTGFPTINFNAVLGCDLSGQGITVLMGRDVLQNFVLVYNGCLGHFILCS